MPKTNSVGQRSDIMTPFTQLIYTLDFLAKGCDLFALEKTYRYNRKVWARNGTDKQGRPRLGVLRNVMIALNLLLLEGKDHDVESKILYF